MDSVENSQLRNVRMHEQKHDCQHSAVLGLQAQDGVCDEGRPGINNSSRTGQQLVPGVVSVVGCDLGTDCGDW